MVIINDLNDPILIAKFAKGMGHNYYGEPAWLTKELPRTVPLNIIIHFYTVNKFHMRVYLYF